MIFDLSIFHGFPKFIYYWLYLYLYSGVDSFKLTHIKCSLLLLAFSISIIFSGVIHFMVSASTSLFSLADIPLYEYILLYIASFQLTLEWQHHLLKTLLSFLKCLGTCVKNQLTRSVRVYFCTLSSIPLISKYILWRTALSGWLDLW